MKPLAPRAAALSQSPIRAVTHLVKAAGGVNLGQGVCDMETPPEAREAAIRALEAGKSTYTHFAGRGSLRAAILEKAQRYNRIPATSTDEVVVSHGATGAFTCAVLTLCEPGDEVILFEPLYGYHTGLLKLYGVTPVAVPLAPPSGGDDRWTLDFDALEAAITPRTKAIVACTPANPCGKVWTREELQRLLGIMQRRDLWAVTDEIYEYMTYDGREHVSLASLPGAYERTITLSGLSKTFNMTGWRQGYAVAPEAVAHQMGLVNDLVYICPAEPLQHGAEAAMRMPQSYYDTLLEDYTAKRTLLCDTLDAIGFEATPPEGAYYVLASFAPRADGAGFEDDDAAMRTLIAKAGVGTVAGRSFFADPERGKHFLRFCYAKEMPVLEEACERLREAFG
jgi:aminotransferase